MCLFAKENHPVTPWFWQLYFHCYFFYGPTIYILFDLLLDDKFFIYEYLKNGKKREKLSELTQRLEFLAHYHEFEQRSLDQSNYCYFSINFQVFSLFIAYYVRFTR